MTPIAAPRGTHDLLPADAPAWEWIHQQHRAIAVQHGYRLVDTPVFEATELFQRGVGDGTDIVDKEMYTFSDRGGRSLTLRPEGTAPVLRAVLGGKLDQQLRPVRVHYAMSMFRYDRPQAGRHRQFAQLGIECIGDAASWLDAEVIEVGWRFMAALGLEGVDLQLNSLGDAEDRARYRAALVEYYTPLRDHLCEDCRRRLAVNPMRLLDCKLDSAHVANAPLISESLNAASGEHFADVLAGLEEAAIPHTINPRLVRGLDYYTHTAFEFWHTSLQGAQNALGGGGRYDGLAEQLGFTPTPGVGYALGVERMITVAQQQGLAPAPGAVATVVACSNQYQDAVETRRLARQLRARSVPTIVDVSSRRLDKKLRDAARWESPLALLVGVEQRPVLRNLLARDQRPVDADRIPEAVAEELARAGTRDGPAP